MLTMKWAAVLVIGAVAWYSVTALGDDLSGANRLLCSVQQVNACFAGSGCSDTPAADLNIPQFIEVDVKARRLATTAASGENRQTVAQTAERSEGRLLLQGHELGRAFSLMVDEAAGHAVFASVAVDRSVVVFAACTVLGNG